LIDENLKEMGGSDMKTDEVVPSLEAWGQISPEI
jgi:hypothetical protein